MLNKRKELKKKIIDTGMSQNDFAYKVNINKTTLSDIIRGRINPTDAEFKKLAKELNCEIVNIIDDSY